MSYFSQLHAENALRQSDQFTDDEMENAMNSAAPTLTERINARIYSRVAEYMDLRDVTPDEWAMMNDYAARMQARYLSLFSAPISHPLFVVPVAEMVDA